MTALCVHAEPAQANVALPKSPLDRFKCVDTSMFYLNNHTSERRMVECHILAVDDESERHLIATEVLKVLAVMVTC